MSDKNRYQINFIVVKSSESLEIGSNDSVGLINRFLLYLLALLVFAPMSAIVTAISSGTHNHINRDYHTTNEIQ